MSIAAQMCSRCIYDTNLGVMDFDDKGVCNYCRKIEGLQKEFGTELQKGESKFSDILDEVKASGRNKKYDCVIGVSGGTDSSYLLMKAKDWGLRPLAVHYDNTWNSAVATMNIERVTRYCNVDLWTYVVNNKEIDDIKLSFLKAGIREFEADTDIGLVQVIRSAAAFHDIKYIFEGHSFLTEGLSPVSTNYFDGGYVADVHDKFGLMKRETFPNLTFIRFIKWSLLYRQKFIRPFWYIKYDKEVAKQELIERTNWQYYGGHHLENRASSFLHTVWLPMRFDLDYRNLALSADVRRGVLTKREALLLYSKKIKPNEELVKYIKKRLKLSDRQYESILTGPVRTWRDFKTYKKRFEFLRPLFYFLAKFNFVTMSFYLKYCFPIEDKK